MPVTKGHCPQPTVDYQDLYIKSPAMLMTIEGGGTIITVSDTWLDVLGYERDEVVGSNIMKFLDRSRIEELDKNHLPLLFNIGLVKNIPARILNNRGEKIDILISTSSRCDTLGNYYLSMVVMTDVSEQKRLEEERYMLAYYDQLTGSPNRFLLHERLNQNLAQGKREKKKVAVLFLDLDRFKWVNDTLGHAAGDELLKIVAKRIEDCIRKADTVARIGGDEFAVILHDISSSDDVRTFAGRILDSLAQPTVIANARFINSASIGIAIYPMDGLDGETLLRNADTAMYAAKNCGCNSYQFFSREMHQREKDKASMEFSLRQAIENGEFCLHYQPQLDLNSGKTTGVEALIRWNHPTQGCLPASRFIPLAEDSGLILPIGEWVLRTACTQAVAWQRAGIHPMRMAVNISARQLARPDFIDMVKGVLHETTLSPELLEIEVAEKTVMEKVQDSISPLNDLKALRIRLAIDDFGTGSASLTRLRKFPFDRIKIAREYVRDIIDAKDQRAIVRAILEFGRSLNLEVIAEGVEVREQLEFLKSNQCPDMQGYYLGRPTTSSELERRFTAGNLH